MSDRSDDVATLRAHLADAQAELAASKKLTNIFKSITREDLPGLLDETDTLRAQLAASDSTLVMAVTRLGGEVDGHETARHNFLQRIDALRRMEEEVALAHAAMTRDADLIATLRAQLADARKHVGNLQEDDVESAARLATIEQIAQGLADALRATVVHGTVIGMDAYRRAEKHLAKFDAYRADNVAR